MSLNDEMRQMCETAAERVLMAVVPATSISARHCALVEAASIFDDGTEAGDYYVKMIPALENNVLTVRVPRKANDPRDAELAALRARVAELEREVAAARESDHPELVLSQIKADLRARVAELECCMRVAAGMLSALSGQGWNATTTHNATLKTCDIFMGSGATSAGNATVEGEPKCTP